MNLRDMNPDEREAYFDERARERARRYDRDVELGDEASEADLLAAVERMLDGSEPS